MPFSTIQMPIHKINQIFSINSGLYIEPFYQKSFFASPSLEEIDWSKEAYKNISEKDFYQAILKNSVYCKPLVVDQKEADRCGLIVFSYQKRQYMAIKEPSDERTEHLMHLAYTKP